MHTHKLDPARLVFELAGHKVHVNTSFDRNVPGGQTKNIVKNKSKLSKHKKNA